MIRLNAIRIRLWRMAMSSESGQDHMMKFEVLKFEINKIALMFVGIAVAIPSFLVISGIGIIDTMLGHILPLIVIPVGLFLIKQFVDDIPNELLEAAKIDGAGERISGNYWNSN